MFLKLMSSRDAFTHGPTGPGPRSPLKFLDLGGPEQNFEKPVNHAITIHANRVLGTIHVTQNFLGVFQGAQIKSGPKAPTDLNAALMSSRVNTQMLYFPQSSNFTCSIQKLFKIFDA